MAAIFGRLKKTWENTVSLGVDYRDVQDRSKGG